jgi:transglutaminase-like putative cysteine protease
MALLAADKKLALAQREPPELLAQTLITLDRPIQKPRKLRKATYRITRSQGRMPDLPATQVQSTRRVDARTMRVTVDLGRSRAAADHGIRPVLHSDMIDGRDEQVVELAEQATKIAGDDRTARAEAMRRFVHDYIDEKGLGVGLATAGEVARTGRGDCTEHAVLLAALLRADGVPSRVASGLIYVDQALGHERVFGYHMWTQAWVGGRWRDLDATLGPDTPFDATHITLATSDMRDGELTNDLVRLAPLIGGLKIEIEDPEE